MFISKEQAKVLTGYDVTSEQLVMAQGIIEAYVGKTEAEVDDASDIAQLGKAVAYQAAYMTDSTHVVFEQASVVQVNNFGSSVTFRQDGASPFISYLAQIACRSLSWRRARTINTGSIFGQQTYADRWATE